MSKTKKKLALSKHKLIKDTKKLTTYIESTDDYKDLIKNIQKRKELEYKLDVLVDDINDNRYKLKCIAYEYNPTLNTKIDQYNKYYENNSGLTTIDNLIKTLGLDDAEKLLSKLSKTHWTGVVESSYSLKSEKIGFISRLFRFGHLTLEALEGLFNGR